MTSHAIALPRARPRRPRGPWERSMFNHVIKLGGWEIFFTAAFSIQQALDAPTVVLGFQLALLVFNTVLLAAAAYAWLYSRKHGL